MNIAPTIFNHPKFIALKAAVGDYAFEAIGRIFGHCQEDQRGEFWPGKSPEYLEIVARWSGESRALWDALVLIGWAALEDGGIRIHQWNEYNSQLISAWTAWRKRHSKSHDSRTTTARDSSDHRTSLSPSLPSGDKEREIKKKGGGVDGAAVKASVAQFAALKEILKNHPGRPGADPFPSPEERLDYRKKRSEFEQLQKKQARGEFS